MRRGVPYLLLAILFLGTGFGVGLGLSEAPSGSVGDPGGVLYSELSYSVTRALPPGAHVMGFLHIEPNFTGSCWTTTGYVEALASFTSVRSVSAVHQYVARALRASGWIQDGPTPGSRGPAIWYEWIGQHKYLANHFIYRWHRRLPRGTNAYSTLQVAVPLNGRLRAHPLRWEVGAGSEYAGHWWSETALQRGVSPKIEPRRGPRSVVLHPSLGPDRPFGAARTP